jgi:hypothetical protein
MRPYQLDKPDPESSTLDSAEYRRMTVELGTRGCREVKEAFARCNKSHETWVRRCEGRKSAYAQNRKIDRKGAVPAVGHPDRYRSKRHSRQRE